jgi:predicted GNAT superfamily acetyltransferase
VLVYRPYTTGCLLTSFSGEASIVKVLYAMKLEDISPFACQSYLLCGVNRRLIHEHDVYIYSHICGILMALPSQNVKNLLLQEKHPDI